MNPFAANNVASLAYALEEVRPGLREPYRMARRIVRRQVATGRIFVAVVNYHLPAYGFRFIAIEEMAEVDNARDALRIGREMRKGIRNGPGDSRHVVFGASAQEIEALEQGVSVASYATDY